MEAVEDSAPLSWRPDSSTASARRALLAMTAQPGGAVGDPVAATHPNALDVTYSISGADAALFIVDEETGQIRVGQAMTAGVGA